MGAVHTPMVFTKQLADRSITRSIFPKCADSARHDPANVVKHGFGRAKKSPAAGLKSIRASCELIGCKNLIFSILASGDSLRIALVGVPPRFSTF